MKGHDYIIAKQQAWARGQGLHLISRDEGKGAKNYTAKVTDNLFEPLSETARASFSSGDGGELGTVKKPGKMQALHSSSALGVNVFHYWMANGEVATIAAACKLCARSSTAPERIEFEGKYPIDPAFRYAPNVDVVIHNREASAIKAYGIECKFSEAYGSYRHGGVDPKYFAKCDDLWAQLPHLDELAQSISPDDKQFRHLHPAQLVKHTLGLMRRYGKGGFRLMYLWYDVPGKDGALHREEAERFARIAKADGLMFHAMTYQEMIVGMQKTLPEEHAAYTQYLAERYL